MINILLGIIEFNLKSYNVCLIMNTVNMQACIHCIITNNPYNIQINVDINLNYHAT